MKKLNFGCGEDIIEDFDNFDIQDFDFNIFPYPIKDNTYDYILLKQVLEHLEKPEKVLQELVRISKDKCKIVIEVPHYNNKGAYNDIQHIHFFNENCFRDFDNLEVIDIELIPTTIGRFCLFEFIRRKLNLFISGLYSKIKVVYSVVKRKKQ